MLAEEGFALTLASRTREKVEAAAGELAALAVQADVAEEADCARLVAAHAERHGGLDVLVNSAGVGIGGTVESSSTRHVDRQLATNLRAIVLVTRESIPLLRASRGLVVNVASLAAKVPSPGLAVYGATKAAVVSLTHSLNAELGGDGVRACALCPGFVDTAMAAWADLPPEQMIQPEDCAEVVRMLLGLSPAARVAEVVIERVQRGGGARDAF